MRFHRKMIREDFTYFTLSDILEQMKEPSMDVTKFASILDKVTSRIDSKKQIQTTEFVEVLTYFDKWIGEVTEP